MISANLCFPGEEEHGLELEGWARFRCRTLNLSVQIPGPHLGLCCPVLQLPACAAVAHLKRRHAGGCAVGIHTGFQRLRTKKGRRSHFGFIRLSKI